jgi:hypothetical protein
MPPKIIALLWDFDKTLSRGYMQEPLFAHYGVDGLRFWAEVSALPRHHADGGDEAVYASESLYLNHILTYTRKGVFAGLNNSLLRSFGALQKLAPGVPDIFEHIDAFASGLEGFRSGDIAIEHYVISTGLRQIVLGSAVAPYMRHIWACEFLERAAPPGFLDGAPAEPGEGVICDVGYVIDHTSKTRAIFEINKGVREGLGVNVNTRIPKDQRRVRFENMIYIADGPSDIPSFSVINERNGRTLGVYQPDSPRDLEQAKLLIDQERVQFIGPADYRPGSATTEWLQQAICEMVERLARTPAAATPPAPIEPTPGHIYD